MPRYVDVAEMGALEGRGLFGFLIAPAIGQDGEGKICILVVSRMSWDMMEADCGKS